MPSEYEQMIASQAIGSISKVTAPEDPAASYEKGMNRISYMPRDKTYEGRESIADVVRKQADKQPIDLYQNPVKVLGGDNPSRDIYASLLDYKFMN